MKYTLLFFPIAIALFTACVSQKEYTELEEVKNYYQTEAATADSLKNEFNKLSEENRQLEIEIRNTRLELEQYVVTNNSLHKSYQEVLDKFNRLADQSRDVLSTTSYEKYSLQEQLTAQQEELDSKKKDLQQLEYDLYTKQQQLSNIEYDYSSMKGSMADKNVRIQELEEMLSLREDDMQQIRVQLNEMLLNFSQSDLSISERGGRLYLSLSQRLLFPSGSTRIDAEGKRALQQLAQSLSSKPDVDIVVEGHTDSDGDAAANWNLSVDRAVSVVNVLTASGINPEQITAAGRGEYVPVVANNTSENKAKNRRIEIILSPNLDKLYEFLGTGR